ncbi:MAG TPA: 1-acyl-sn-glycerol-3-phosphate acyltransferase [Bacteroidales bacterium]|nr:1-acyl-sn-glycerol-3-phosphate acyltransferase [Bacteroidales bacterium]
MHKGYFGSGTYITPEKNLNIADRIFFHTRLYFTLKFARTVLTSRHQAKRGRYGNKEWADSSWYIFRFIERSGGRFHITGMENITKTPAPVLFIANHMSTLETMILPCIISPLRKVTFVVKESLVKHPLFGDVMRSRDPIIVGRTDPRKDLEAVMNGGMELLSKGISIVIFPQSTRNVIFKPEEFNSLGVKLAKKAGVQVVPVALKTDFWGNGKLIKEIGPLDSSKTIYFRFGEPFEVKGTGREENQKIIDFIESWLDEWQ